MAAGSGDATEKEDLTLWLLNHLPTWGLAIAMLVGACALGVGLQRLVLNRVAFAARGEHTEVIGIFLALIGGFYSLLLAFVIVSLWEDFETATSSVDAEASALAKLVRNSQGLPDEVSRGIERTAARYISAVVDEEWELMRTKRESNEANDAVSGLYVTLQSFEPGTVTEETFQQEAASNLDDLVDNRRSRIRESRQEIPTILKVLIFGGAVVMLVFTALVGVKHRRLHLTLVVAVSVVLALNLLIMVVLDHPFAGGVAISSEAFTQGELAGLR